MNLEIISTKNPKYRRWLSLLDSKGIKAEKQALVSGKKIVQEFMHERPQNVVEVLLPPKAEDFQSEHKSYRLSSPLFNALDVLGTKGPLLVVELQERSLWQSEPPQGLELVLALSDPNNLGAVIRSAVAFGVKKLILTSECCSPFLPKTIRASSGSVFRVPIFYARRFAEMQFPSDSSIFALDLKGQTLASANWPRDLFLVLGEEGQGIPNSLKNKAKVEFVHIPMADVKTESLNATVAASIALYSYSLKIGQS